MKLTNDPSGQKSKAGFSLLELAIFMGIVGIMAATTLQTYQTYANSKAIQTTKGHLAEINAALINFLAKNNNRLPCPADPSDPPNDPDSGMEISTCAADAVEGAIGSCTPSGYCASPGRDADGNFVPDLALSGYVPYITLGLPLQSSLDGWGRKIKYVVSAKLTKSATYNVNYGAIGLIYKNGAPVLTKEMTTPNSAHVLLLSHGPDGKGAYTLNGNLHAACPPSPANGRDFENCNEPTNATYYDRSERSFVSGADHYDDYVHPEYIITSNADRWKVSTTTLQNGALGRVGIGTYTPTNPLHVAGDIKAGELITAQLCNYGGGGSVASVDGLTGANCLPYDLFGDTGSSCATGAMTGIKNAAAACALSVKPGSIPAYTCPTGEVACGIKAGGNLRCRIPGAAICPP